MKYPKLTDLTFPKNVSWLEKNTNMLVVHGSHCYGLANEQSDVDLRGIAIPPKSYYLGLRNRFEQYIGKSEYDITIFELKKFLNLCIDNNPNALEILFVDSEFHIHIDPIGQKIIDNRDLFLSKKLRFTLYGYALSQLRRIERHRRWLVSPPKTPPTREEYGLPSYNDVPKHKLEGALAMIRKQIEEWDFDWQTIEESQRINLKNCYENHLLKYQLKEEDMFANTTKLMGFDTKFVDILQKEKEYKAKVDEWDQYQHWLKNRNPKRAEMEKKYHMDLKHASHLIRLCRMCEEVLATGKFNVNRKNIDAEELVEIKNNGIWTYEQLMTWAEKQEEVIKKLYESCTLLPESANIVAIDNLCEDIIYNHIK